MTIATIPRTQLGRTGLEISRIGFGAWAIGGGDWEFGWGPQEDDASIATIHRALDLGINWIDTAAGYGSGHSERIVARALEGCGDRPLVFTKAGILRGPGGTAVRCLERDSILREAHASLERLRVDAIDLYQIHWPIPDEDVEQAWSAFAELREQGFVRHIGVSNFSVEQMRRAEQIAPVETLQPPYSLIVRDAESETLPFCRREGIGVIVYSPMGSGMLTGRVTRERIDALPAEDWRRRSDNFREPALSANLALVERLKAVAERHDCSAGAVAVAWTLRNPAVDAAIVGFRDPAQLDPIMAGASVELTDADVAELEAPRRDTP